MNNRRTIQTDGTAAREQLKAEINREELVERIARLITFSTRWLVLSLAS